MVVHYLWHARLLAWIRDTRTKSLQCKVLEKCGDVISYDDCLHDKEQNMCPMNPQDGWGVGG